jgi:hypothetical protein
VHKVKPISISRYQEAEAQRLKRNEGSPNAVQQQAVHEEGEELALCDQRRPKDFSFSMKSVIAKVCG